MKKSEYFKGYDLFKKIKPPTFALSLTDVQVCLLPQLVALAEVAAEVVLVLHHVLGDGETDRRVGRWRRYPRHTGLATARVAARL